MFERGKKEGPPSRKSQLCMWIVLAWKIIRAVLVPSMARAPGERTLCCIRWPEWCEERASGVPADSVMGGRGERWRTFEVSRTHMNICRRDTDLIQLLRKTRITSATKTKTSVTIHLSQPGNRWLRTALPAKNRRVRIGVTRQHRSLESCCRAYISHPPWPKFRFGNSED